MFSVSGSQAKSWGHVHSLEGSQTTASPSVPLLNKLLPTLPLMSSLQKISLVNGAQALPGPEHSGKQLQYPKSCHHSHICYFICSVHIHLAPTLLLPVVGARNPEVNMTKSLPSRSLESLGNRRSRIHLHAWPRLG